MEEKPGINIANDDIDSVGGSFDERIVTDDQASDPDIYVYDIEDDEPVDDRDLYKDLEIVRKVRTEPKAVPKPEKTVPAATETVPVSPEITEDDASDYQEEKSPSPRNNRLYIINLVISMITLCVSAAGIFTAFVYAKQLERALSISENRISALEEKSTAVSDTVSGTDEFVDAVSLIDEEELNEPDIPDDLVDIDKGKLLLYDSYVGYSWVPVISGVKPNNYDKSDFKVDNDFRMQYVPGGELSSYFGIDVSSYQGDIDWDAVRSDGVEFAILRIGVRGYAEEGNIKLDDKFIQNYENAHKAGIDLGVYFYSQAISTEEAREEANFVLEKLEGRKLEYPVVFDWEPVDEGSTDITPRTEDVMPGTLTLSALAFCETIRDAGYEAMIYTNKKMAYIKYDMRKFADYPVWLALYNTELTYYYDFDMWQYGFGKVDGIEGEVDFDISIIR
ncbi:MAG: glycoside hydrolase family 25 protein [Ruminiclostridium sp.]|nr:glycoside hydrolase family 25 protein [Ruminiclostridium sp.]